MIVVMTVIDDNSNCKGDDSDLKTFWYGKIMVIMMMITGTIIVRMMWMKITSKVLLVKLRDKITNKIIDKNGNSSSK